jgi:hypothetical protein
MDVAGFESGLRSDGFAEIEIKSLPAKTHNGEHEHPFDVRALVLEGRIALIVNGRQCAGAPADRPGVGPQAGPDGSPAP